jgi:hypothetical protein
VGKGKVAAVVLGNPFSDFIDAVQNAKGAAGTAAGDVASYYAPDALRRVPNVAVTATWVTVVRTESELWMVLDRAEAYLPLGKIAAKVADPLEKLGNVITIPVSATATAFGAVTCAAGS